MLEVIISKIFKVQKEDKELFKMHKETDTKDWLNYLASQGAIIQDNRVVSFSNPTAELDATTNNHIICDLSHLGLLEINGADAITFLQGQVTNDVKLLDGNTSHYTGYCNPKGRLLALFFAFNHYNHLHLQFDRELVVPILKRLKMYVMRSKVDITDTTTSIIKIGLSGENAGFLLESLFVQVPKNEYDLVNLENGTLVRLAGSKPRYEIFTSDLHASTIWNCLKQHCMPVGKDCWDSLEIEAGIPEIVSKTQEEFVPQMLNLDLLDAINFKKGCYTGQEIVARTHYLGKVKRRTLRGQIETIELPEAGDDILNGAQDVVGKIVRSAPALGNKADVLVEVRLDSVVLDNPELSTLTWQKKVLALHVDNIKLLK